METTGNKIKRLRLEKGLSQAQLAEMVGFQNRSAINKLESGERTLNQDRIEPMAKALDCDPSWLMGWDSKIGDTAVINLIMKGIDDHATRQRIIHYAQAVYEAYKLEKETKPNRNN